MASSRECPCCIEVEEIAAKAGARCITRHKDFFGAILNPVVLQIAYSMRAMELNDRELAGQRSTHKYDFLRLDHIAQYQQKRKFPSISISYSIYFFLRSYNFPMMAACLLMLSQLQLASSYHRKLR
uniref:Uncharacterized protein n=1 Tax=Ixodes ricinus TaxID=34613 RepID=A0A147BB42_IXORI